MMRGRNCCAALLLLSNLCIAETMEEVEKKLMDAHAKLKSYTATLKRVENVPLTGTDFMASDVDGTVEWMRKGDAILFRMEIAGSTTQKFGENESKSHQTSTFVCDGEMFYTYAEQMGQKRFIKQDMDSSIRGDIRSVLDTVRLDNEFRLAPDDKVDGADCYVIEVTPKVAPSDANPVHKTLIFMRKDIGLSVRVVSRNKAGKDVFDHTLLNLKKDVNIDAARFVLKVPEGVEVTDMTVVDNPSKPGGEGPPLAKPEPSPPPKP